MEAFEKLEVLEKEFALCVVVFAPLQYSRERAFWETRYVQPFRSHRTRLKVTSGTPEKRFVRLLRKP
jgi:hypothetical protein